MDYANLISKLEKVVGMVDKIEQMYVCDLGLSKKNEQKFAELLDKITSAGVEVIYIDHHDISKETLQALKKAGVTLVHTVDRMHKHTGLYKIQEKTARACSIFCRDGSADRLHGEQTSGIGSSF